MCGISALFGLNQSPSVFNSILSMNSLVRHRGPDDEGYAFFSSQSPHVFYYAGSDTPSSHLLHPKYPYTPSGSYKHPPSLPLLGAFGHRRLSILDISEAGHQPMSTDDRQVWIVYNGEVYNFIEIRQELQAAGHTFHSHSDTEVILKAYLHWGEESLHHFNGMFAFVIYDIRQQKIFAARDRFGVKPLYYWISPQGLLALGSEIKQFTSLPGWRAKINGQRCYDYLVWSIQDHTQETLFSGVKQLRGGEKFSWHIGRDKHPTIQPWYTLSPQPLRHSFQEASHHFLELLDDAVRLRLRADVDIGSCLSGGLDSSSIVCLANRHLSRQDSTTKQKTFSACSHVKRFDESDYIHQVVQQCQVDAYYCYPSPEGLFAKKDNLIWHQDEPYGSTSIYAQWEVFNLVKEQGVKVMLDGQGADEQLIGYHSSFANKSYELFSQFQFLSLAREIIQTQQLHGSSAFVHLLRPFIPNKLVDHLRKWRNQLSQKPRWLNFPLLNANSTPPFPNQKRLSINEGSLLQISHSHLPMLLHWEDRNSMAHSVESRTPFLDYRLVEFVCGLPPDYKLNGGITKRVMREGMRKILPESIRTRVDKMGFVTAEEMWLRQKPDAFRRALKSSLEASQGILNADIFPLAEEIIAGKKPFNFLIWRLINFGEWMRRFACHVGTF